VDQTRFGGENVYYNEKKPSKILEKKIIKKKITINYFESICKLSFENKNFNIKK